MKKKKKRRKLKVSKFFNNNDSDITRRFFKAVSEKEKKSKQFELSDMMKKDIKKTNKYSHIDKNMIEVQKEKKPRKNKTSNCFTNKT